MLIQNNLIIPQDVTKPQTKLNTRFAHLQHLCFYYSYT